MRWIYAALIICLFSFVTGELQRYAVAPLVGFTGIVLSLIVVNGATRRN